MCSVQPPLVGDPGGRFSSHDRIGPRGRTRCREEVPMTERPNFDRPSLRSLWLFYGNQFRVDVAINLAYRRAVAIWLLSTVMQPLVSLVVWRTVAGSNDGSTGGFTANEYTAYFVAVMIVNHLTFIWHMWEFEWRIRTGFFS